MSDATVLPRTFKPGDLVRNRSHAYQGQDRIVREINPVEDDCDMLIVRINEEDEKSLVWSWFASICELVPPTFKEGDRVTIGSNPTPGTITSTRIHHNSKAQQFLVQRDGETRTHWVIASALHHVAATVPDLAQVEAAADSVDYKMSATDDLVLDYDKIEQLQRDQDELRGTFHPVEAQRIMPIDTAAYDQRIADLERQLKDSLAANAKLEKRYFELENMIVTNQPVPVAQRKCIETQTVWQEIGTSEKSKAADADWAKLRTQGWTLVNITYSADLNKRALMMEHRSVTAPQPSHTSTSAAAMLTGDYVRAQRPSPFRDPVTINPDGEPVTNRREYNTALGDLTRAFGVDTVGDKMDDIAIRSALSRRAERGPILQALIPLKAGE